MKIILVVVALAVTVFATATFAHDGSHDTNERGMEHRIFNKLHNLEQQMESLQHELREIKRLLRYQSGPVIVDPAVREWGCYLETPFNGTFSAKGDTQAEAIGKTLQRCNERSGNSIHCNDKRVVCSGG